MIVFVAMIVAAAVAGAVLIRTAGELERRAGATGDDATQEAAGNIYVRDVIGNVTSPDGTDVVTEVRWYVEAAPGSDPIDLDALILRWSHAQNRSDLERGDGACEDGLRDGFCLTDVHDAGDGDVSLLSDGDTVRIEVDLNASEDEDLGTREHVGAVLLPETGTPADAGFDTPATYGNRSNVNLIEPS